jgi:hypothetical protein
VLDSTPLYDAVSTMDTITPVRSAIRQLLGLAGEREEELRAALPSGDHDESDAKARIDWEDETAREELIDSRAKDGYAVLARLDGEQLPAELSEAASLLASVLGQDLEQRDDGRFVIAYKVAKDRVISIVDPETGHGHKTAARGFEGYKECRYRH